MEGGGGGGERGEAERGRKITNTINSTNTTNTNTGNNANNKAHAIEKTAKPSHLILPHPGNRPHQADALTSIRPAPSKPHPVAVGSRVSVPSSRLPSSVALGRRRARRWSRRLRGSIVYGSVNQHAYA